MAWLSKLRVKICLLVMVVGSVAGAYALFKLYNPMTSQKVSVTSPPLEFSMELDKTKFQYGENITIKFRLENIGNKTIRIRKGQPTGWPDTYRTTSYARAHSAGPNPVHNPYPGSYRLHKEFHFGFKIMDVNGTEIFDVTEGVLAYAYEFRMDPSGWIEQTIIIDYYSIEWADLYNPYRLSRGTYQIKGAIKHGLNSGPIYTLETPSITFTIE